MIIQILGIIGIIGLVSVLLEGIFGCTYNVSSFKGCFKGCLTDNEFKTLMDLMAEDPKLYFDGFSVYGAGYKVWVCNGYFAFRVNDEEDFTPRQRHMFFRRFKTLIAGRNIPSIARDKNLQLQKISDRLFTKQLEEKLDDE